MINKKKNRFSIYYMQDGGVKKSDPLKKQNALSYGSEIILPVTYVGKGVHPDSKAEGYNVYYGDPNKPDTDKVFFTNEEFELKRNYRPSVDNPSYNREPYLMKYLDKTQGRLNQLVHYSDGGEHLPIYQNGVSFNNQFQQPQLDAFGNPINFKPIDAPQNQTIGRAPNFVSQISEKSITAGEDFKKEHPLPQKGFTNQPNFGASYQDPYQFFNPYGGVDIPTAANYLGQSIEEGNAFGIVTGGLKVAAGLGRNIFGGIGQQRRKQEALKTYNKNKLDKLKGDFRPLFEEQRWNGSEGHSFQEGGIYPQLESSQVDSFPNGIYEAPSQQFPTGIYQTPELENTNPDFDTNSARDMWVQKTGMPWSEAKRLGYTDGSAKDNTKLLSELKDPRFKKEYLRKEPIKKVTKQEAKKIIPPQLKKNNEIEEVVIKAKVLDGRKSAGVPFANKEAERKYYQDNGYQIIDKNVMPVWNQSKPTFEYPTMRQKYQEGGEQQAPQMEQVIQQVAKALQQGVNPQEVLNQLIQTGISQEEAEQLIQGIIQQMQGATPEQQTNTEQQTMMKSGGYYMENLRGKKIIDYTFNPETNSYDVEYE